MIVPRRRRHGQVGTARAARRGSATASPRARSERREVELAAHRERHATRASRVRRPRTRIGGTSRALYFRARGGQRARDPRPRARRRCYAPARDGNYTLSRVPPVRGPLRRSVEIDGDRVVSVRGDRDDPFSRGHVCPKVYGQGRARGPRTAQTAAAPRGRRSLEPIGWDEAFALARRSHRRHAARPRSQRRGRVRGQSNVPQFRDDPVRAVAVSPARHPHTVSATSAGPAAPDAGLALDVRPPAPAPDSRRRPHGPSVDPGRQSRGVEWQPDDAPESPSGSRPVRRARGRVVVVDPRRTQTLRSPTSTSFIQPGTDALLLAAMVRTISRRTWRGPGGSRTSRAGSTTCGRAAGFRPSPWRRRSASRRRHRADAREFARAPRAAC